MHKRISPHGDLDHIGAALALNKKFKPDRIYLNSNSLNRYEKELMPKARQLFYLDEIKTKNLSIINYGKNYQDENESSLILSIIVKNNVKLLFMGDAGVKAETALPKLDNYDILKLGHHGSKTSTSESFVNKVKPRYAIVSAGKDNHYGHPHKEIIQRLKKNSTKIFYTYKSEVIKFKLK